MQYDFYECADLIDDLTALRAKLAEEQLREERLEGMPGHVIPLLGHVMLLLGHVILLPGHVMPLLCHVIHLVGHVIPLMFVIDIGILVFGFLVKFR